MTTTRFFLIAGIIISFIACSEEKNIELNSSERLKSFEVNYEKMKSETQAHNVVLEDFYNYAVEKGLKINHLFTYSESVNLVKSYIENTPSTRIRKINTKFVIDNLEFILSNNRYLFSMKTRTDNDFIGGENFDYLNSFLKEFSALDFNILNKENIDAKIKWILNVILQKYPELEKQEI